MGRLQQIGSAFVRLFVKKDELDRGLNEAKTQVNQTAQQMNQSAGKAATGFSGVANSIKGATKPARDLLSAVVGTLGIFTRMLGIVGLLTGALVAAWTAAKRLSGFGEDAAKNLRQAAEEGKRLQEILRGATPENLDATIQKIKEEGDLNGLLERQAKLLDRIALARKVGAQQGSILEDLADGDLRKVEKAIDAITDRINAARKVAADVAAQRKAAEDEATLDRLTKERRDIEKQANDDAVRQREEQIEAARQAARDLLEAEREVQDIIAESDRIREENHKKEMKRIEERAEAERAAIEAAQQQTIASVNALQQSFNNLSVSLLASIDKQVRLFLNRPFDKRN